MNHGDAIKHEFRQIERGSSDQAVSELIQYIEEALPEFPNSFEFIDILEKKKNENQHSLSFCVYMTNKCKSTYYFARENAQRGSYTIDIGIYQGSNLIFTIEAKLLPSPKQNSGPEHQYVYGKGAGIQRFKDGLHGVDNQNNPLTENGMIAYIKDRDFEFWLLKINQWVLEANWDKSEQLEKIYFKTIAKLFSEHPRQRGSTVRLYHFWIYVS